MKDWSCYRNALEIFEDKQANRCIDLMGPGHLLGQFLAKARAAKTDTRWVLASNKTHRALVKAGLALVPEFLRFSESNTETLRLTENVLKEGARRICIGLPDDYDGTKFTLLKALTGLAQENPGCQIVLLRASAEAYLPSPAPCRILLETEEELFCHTDIARLLKIAGVPVLKRFESHRYSFAALREHARRAYRTGAPVYRSNLSFG